MMLPPTATSVQKASTFPFGVSAGTMVRSRDQPESTVPQEPCVTLSPPTGAAPKTCIPDARCGSAPPTLYSRSTGSGWARILPGGCTLDETLEPMKSPKGRNKTLIGRARRRCRHQINSINGFTRKTKISFLILLLQSEVYLPKLLNRQPVKTVLKEFPAS